MKTFFFGQGATGVCQSTFTRHEGMPHGALINIRYQKTTDGTAWYVAQSYVTVFERRADAISLFNANSAVYEPLPENKMPPSSFIERSTTNGYKRLDYIAYKRSLCNV